MNNSGADQDAQESNLRFLLITCQNRIVLLVKGIVQLAFSLRMILKCILEFRKLNTSYHN